MRIPSKLNKGIKIVLFVIFIMFAVLQLNDPDPVFWVIIYGTVAVLCLISGLKSISKFILWTALVAVLLLSVRYFPYVVDWWQTDNRNEIFGEMVYEKPYLEGSREFIGLILSALALLYLLRSK
ncbi:transmembrane 220 family protein [Tamlana fucoidanivorans]|uniref:Transmembrane family 220, helix n=1 Tax=Allotamlana fucoidanivorans TaxID=2583814 RepID=A0A5C4SJR4_9FLAO|nr:transmembrane 220 family protein [Tamlana fucoidanivorans]TNJ43683.1 hypothetical protein FGF67_09930 [Tamlana fucoidanivorans]